MDIRVPFLKTPVGLGDAVKTATTAVGVKPCGGCKQRAAGLNKAVQFVPAAKSVLPVATVGKAYAAPIPGGLTGGAIPPGLVWDRNVQILHGVPNEAGDYDMRMGDRVVSIKVVSNV